MAGPSATREKFRELRELGYYGGEERQAAAEAAGDSRAEQLVLLNIGRPCERCCLPIAE